MKRLLLLSLILFAASWACCHLGTPQRNATAQPVAGAASQATPDVFTFDEDADLTPTEGLGCFLFFIALAIPMVIVIVKLGSRERGG